LQFLIMPPFVVGSALLAFLLVATFWLSRSRIKEHWSATYWLVFLQFLAFPALTAVSVLGAVEAIPWPRQQPHTWAVWTSGVVFWGCVAYGAFCVWRMKHLRGIAVVLFLCCQWLMQGAAVISSSALSGIWP
jgi:hypothetical protein